MPELPEVERVRGELATAMTGARFERVIINRSDLRQPLPVRFGPRLKRQVVRAVARRGKYLLVDLSSGDTLIMHLGMSGWFRVEPTAEIKRRARVRPRAVEQGHDHVIFEMSSGMTVTFTDPRRFGLMDLVAPAGLSQHAPLARLGPEPLSPAFGAAALARGCANRHAALKVALLDQRLVAGLGNIYASEALHLARLSPFRRAGSITSAAGVPRPSCVRLADAIKSVLQRAISRNTSPGDGARFRAYDREGQRCPTRGCRGRIARVWQAGRSTFYCPVCQR